MRGVMRWAVLVVVLLSATMLSGCEFMGCGHASQKIHSVSRVGLRLLGDKRVALRTPLQLHAAATYRLGDEINSADVASDEANLKWVVQPSDGAVVSSTGIFTATKPGVYTVTVSLANPNGQLTTSTKVYATEPESTETTEESETTEETATTETTVGNTFAGTYKGSWLWTAGQSKADVPWAFVVDAQGDLNGGFDTMLSADTKVVCVLTGQVSVDGKVDASGTADTTISGVGSNSTPMTLTGQIASGKFTGKLVGSGGKAVEVTATLQ
jgi:hypothetical protein